MSCPRSFATAVLIVSLCVSLGAPISVAVAANDATFERRATIASTLESALSGSATAAESSERLQRARLVLALETAAASVEVDSQVAAAIRAEVDASRMEPDSGARERLERAARVAIDRLRFRIVDEAPLPKGFPGPTPLDEIEVKSYPKYRLAIAEVGMTGTNTAFFQLFRHISSNEIAMTAPVETEYDEKRPVTMAFLYGDPDMGEVGKDGIVRIIDKDPVTVVSLGLRGYENRDRVQRVAQRLREYIGERSDLEIAGEVRVMGYNSPRVSESRRFFEVQIPVAPRSVEL